MKEGDKVMCMKTFICPTTGEQQFTAGETYIVKEVVDKNVMVEKDDCGHKDNGWRIKFFQEVQ